jgi:gas vesicle protein
MRTFETLRLNVLELFSELIDIAKVRGAEEAVQRLVDGQQRLLDERLVVVVCGEFKRGKSSLLNALLDEPGLFPVDAFYATGVITTAGYGAPETITVTLSAGPGGIRQKAIGRDEIAAYATESGNPHNAKQVELVAVHTPNPRLAPGLILVDTPGVGGVFDEHSAVTLGFLQSASALVFVADATQPLLESELAFIRRAAETARVTDDPDGYLFVLTKIDAVGDYRPILANMKAKLAEVTGRPAESIPVVPVSARAKLDYLRNGSADYLELSNFAVLEQMLWTALARRRARALLSSSLADLDLAAQALLVPLETEARALTGENRELAELAVQTEDRAAWLAELRGNKDSWRKDLSDQLDQVVSQLKKDGQQSLDRVWRDCQTVYLHNASYLAAPDLLLNQVLADASATFAELSERTARAAARALQDFSVRHGLELRRPEIDQLPEPPVPRLQLAGQVAKAGKPFTGLRLLTSAGDGSRSAGVAGASIGMAVGAIVGSVVPGPGTLFGMNVGSLVGFTLGSAIGTVTGYRDAVQEARNQGVQLHRDRLWKELEPLRESQKKAVNDDLEELRISYAAAATRELESRIAQEHESVTEALSRLRALRDHAERAVDIRRAELAAERAPLDRVFEQIGSIAAVAAEMGGPR